MTGDVESDVCRVEHDPREQLGDRPTPGHDGHGLDSRSLEGVSQRLGGKKLMSDPAHGSDRMVKRISKPFKKRWK